MLVTLAIGVAACGGDDGDETPEQNAGTTGATVETLSSAEEFAARGRQPEVEARRLREAGFVSFARRELEGKSAGPGVTSVMLFADAAGAKAQAAEERRTLNVDFRGWTLKRFDVPGVPGAFGWTARNRTARARRGANAWATSPGSRAAAR